MNLDSQTNMKLDSEIDTKPDSETDKRGKAELKRRKDRHKISKRNSASAPEFQSSKDV